MIRLLLHLAVSLQTSDFSHGLLLSPVESFFVYTPQCPIRVKPRSAPRCTFRIAYLTVCTAYTTRVIHNVSQRRQRKEDWLTVIGNMHIELGEVWTCDS